MRTGGQKDLQHLLWSGPSEIPRPHRFDGDARAANETRRDETSWILDVLQPSLVRIGAGTAVGGECPKHLPMGEGRPRLRTGDAVGGCQDLRARR
jgi:hypothetical protein